MAQIKRPPFGWYGGKGNQVAKLLKLVPDHQTYVEVFGGSGALLFAKEPAKVEVYNDLDSGLVNFFRVIRDKKKLDELYRMSLLTPTSREEYKSFKKDWHETEDEIERAFKWFYVINHSYSGSFGAGFSTSVTENWRGVAGSVAAYLSRVERLPEIFARIMTVQIEQQDFRKLIKRYDTENTFFYLDPPYVHETRSDLSAGYKDTKSNQQLEMSNAEHEELVDLLVALKGKALLSGYDNPIYERLIENGWKKIHWKIGLFAAAAERKKEKEKRIETVWLNYDGSLE